MKKITVCLLATAMENDSVAAAMREFIGTNWRQHFGTVPSDTVHVRAVVTPFLFGAIHSALYMAKGGRYGRGHAETIYSKFMMENADLARETFEWKQRNHPWPNGAEYRRAYKEGLVFGKKRTTAEIEAAKQSISALNAEITRLRKIVKAA